MATTLVHVVGDPKVSSLSVVKDERALVLDEKDEVNVALAAGTPESIALAVEEISPDLARQSPRGVTSPRH